MERFEFFPNLEALRAYCAEFDYQDPPYGNCSGVVWGRYASTEGQFGPKHEVYKLVFGTGGVMWAIVPRCEG